MPDPAPMQQPNATITPPVVAQQPQVATPQAPTAASPPATSLPGEPLPMAMPVAPNGANGVPVTSIAPPAIVGVPEAPTPRATRAPVRTVTPPASAEPAPVATGPAPVAGPVESIGEPVAAAPVGPIADAPTQPNLAVTETGETNGEVWGWMAALLAALGIGGGAIALRRSRTRKSAAVEIEGRDSDSASIAPRNAMAGPHDRPGADELVLSKPVIAAAPARFDKPVIQSPTSYVSQAPSVAISSQTQRKAPVTRKATGEHDVDQRQLEQMIAQRPGRDNPFVTRANRKRRAIFLLRNRYPVQTAA